MMILIRKFDLYAQAAIILFTVCFLWIGVDNMIGLFVLGIWQVTSAAINTGKFIIASRRRTILLYWLFVLIDLGILFLAPYTSVTLAALYGSLGFAIYYWIVYDNLISYLEFKNEISGVLKS